MARIIVTGGYGFIGGHFVSHVLDNTDWLITVMDWSRHYACDATKFNRYGWNDRVNFIDSDLRKLAPCPPADYIVSFASESHVDRSIERPEDFILSNVMIGLNVLEAARRIKPKRMILISTDEVLGATPDAAFTEDQRISPSNPYAASKAAQEAMAASYRTTYGVPVTCTRCTNNFGADQDAEKFLPIVANRLTEGKPVIVHGQQVDGEWQGGSRYWLHVRSHADAILHLLQCEGELPQVVHVPGQQELTNLEVVHRAAAILDKTPIVEWQDFHAARPGHDRRYALDGSRLMAMGWKFPTEFEADFRQTVLALAKGK